MVNRGIARDGHSVGIFNEDNNYNKHVKESSRKGIGNTY